MLHCKTEIHAIQNVCEFPFTKLKLVATSKFRK